MPLFGAVSHTRVSSIVLLVPASKSWPVIASPRWTMPVRPLGDSLTFAC
jgi:hypothetical protein